MQLPDLMQQQHIQKRASGVSFFMELKKRVKNQQRKFWIPKGVNFEYQFYY
jgi:hypothetical protein